MDGAYKGKYTDPGGFVKPGKTFQYVWDARPGTEGVWPYHDHGPMDPVPLYKGLFGRSDRPQAGRAAAGPRVLPLFHSFTPPATGLHNSFLCINGRSYAGNTPTLTAKVGQRVA